MQEHNTTLKYKDEAGELHIHYPYTTWGNVLDRPNVATLGADGKVAAGQLPSLDYVPNTEKGVAGGVATLGDDGLVPESQLPSLDYVPNTEKGQAGGVATLGDDGKVPQSQLPATEAGGGFVAAETAPENTGLLWIDTSENILKYYDGSAWIATAAVWG